MTDNNLQILFSEAIVIHMCVVVAVWRADTLVAAPAEPRMNSCGDASSKAGTSKGNTTSKGNSTSCRMESCDAPSKADTSITRRAGYNGSGCHNRSSSWDEVGLMRM